MISAPSFVDNYACRMRRWIFGCSQGAIRFNQPRYHAVYIHVSAPLQRTSMSESSIRSCTRIAVPFTLFRRFVASIPSASFSSPPFAVGPRAAQHFRASAPPRPFLILASPPPLCPQRRPVHVAQPVWSHARPNPFDARPSKWARKRRGLLWLKKITGQRIITEGERVADRADWKSAAWSMPPPTKFRRLSRRAAPPASWTFPDAARWRCDDTGHPGPPRRSRGVRFPLENSRWLSRSIADWLSWLNSSRRLWYARNLTSSSPKLFVRRSHYRDFSE